jgi:hypothetical protein
MAWIRGSTTYGGALARREEFGYTEVSLRGGSEEVVLGVLN